MKIHKPNINSPMREDINKPIKWLRLVFINVTLCKSKECESVNDRMNESKSNHKSSTEDVLTTWL